MLGTEFIEAPPDAVATSERGLMFRIILVGIVLASLTLSFAEACSKDAFGISYRTAVSAL
jgi:hypothetical protein